ncbi:MAG: fimbrial biogenesis outer membrane usher protein [Oligoflexia bacterium]|nr:fimbrial biogenesis outer membrane usher protein [Oligoflexia bacterium]
MFHKKYILTLLIIAISLEIKSEEDLFKKVFGQKKNESTIDVPLILNNDYIGEVKVVMEAGGNLRFIGKDSLLKTLNNFLDAETLDKVRSLDSNINPVDLKKSGIQNNFNYKDLQLKIVTPISNYRLRKYQFNRREPYWAKSLIEKPAASGYLNYDLQRVIGDTNNFESNFKSYYDLVFNFKDIVIENDFHYFSNDKKVIRDSSLITKKFEKKLTKLEIGDFTNISKDLQSSQSLSGINYSSDYTIDPYFNVKPLSNREFILNRKSKVKIFVNGRLLKSLILNKGKHSLSSLNLNNGINLIDLEVEDFDGNTSRISLQDISSDRLLKKGIHSFSYGLGVDRDENLNQVKYDVNNEGVKADFIHEYGITNYLTLGAFAQGNDEHFQLGPSVKATTPIGFFALDTSLSKVDKVRNQILNDRAGVKAEAEYYIQYPDREGYLRSFNAVYSYTSPFYTDVNSFNSQNRIANNISLRYSQDFLRYLGVTIGSNYGIDRYKINDTYSTNFGLTIRPFNRTIINLTFSRSKNLSGVLDSSVFAFLNYSFEESPQNIFMSYNDQNDSSSVEWTKNPSGHNNSIGSQLQVSQSNTGKAVNGNITLLSQKFRSTLTGNFQENDLIADKKTGSVELAGALAWAGNSFAFSRPITSSFAIVKSKNDLEGAKLYLNKSKRSHDGVISDYSNAVLPELQEFQYYRVNVDPSDLANHQQLKKDHFPIRTSFKSGHEILIDVSSNYVIQGTLKRKNGVPLSLVIVSLKDLSGNIISEFFTNNEGRFLIEDIEPGTYQISYNDLNTKVEVSKESQLGYINLGDVLL